MSIVGTRPPLISETNLYELHHRAKETKEIKWIVSFEGHDFSGRGRCCCLKK